MILYEIWFESETAGDLLDPPEPNNQGFLVAARDKKRAIKLAQKAWKEICGEVEEPMIVEVVNRNRVLVLKDCDETENNWIEFVPKIPKIELDFSENYVIKGD
jgi:hypothetical protein